MIIAIQSVQKMRDVNLEEAFPAFLLDVTTEVVVDKFCGMRYCVSQWAEKHGFGFRAGLPPQFRFQYDTATKRGEALSDYSDYTVFFHDGHAPRIEKQIHYCETNNLFHFIVYMRQDNGEWRHYMTLSGDNMRGLCGWTEKKKE